jgi:hypothetical protein
LLDVLACVAVGIEIFVVLLCFNDDSRLHVDLGCLDDDRVAFGVDVIQRLFQRAARRVGWRAGLVHRLLSFLGGAAIRLWRAVWGEKR